MKLFSALLLTCCLVPSIVSAQPANDDCLNALPLPTNLVSFDATNSTFDAPAPSCGLPSQPNVWFSWTAPTSGTAMVNTCGSSFDTALAVYTGACGALTELACNDDSCGLQSQLSFTASVGSTYLIQVSGLTPATGSIRVAIASSILDLATARPPLSQIPDTRVLGYDNLSETIFAYDSTGTIVDSFVVTNWTVPPTIDAIAAGTSAIYLGESATSTVYRVQLMSGGQAMTIGSPFAITTPSGGPFGGMTYDDLANTLWFADPTHELFFETDLNGVLLPRTFTHPRAYQSPSTATTVTGGIAHVSGTEAFLVTTQDPSAPGQVTDVFLCPDAGNGYSQHIPVMPAPTRPALAYLDSGPTGHSFLLAKDNPPDGPYDPLIIFTPEGCLIVLNTECIRLKSGFGSSTLVILGRGMGITVCTTLELQVYSRQASGNMAWEDVKSFVTQQTNHTILGAGHEQVASFRLSTIGLPKGTYRYVARSTPLVSNTSCPGDGIPCTVFAEFEAKDIVLCDKPGLSISGTGTSTTTLNVATLFDIATTCISIDIDHGFTLDLANLSITSPQGTSVDMFSQNGSGSTSLFTTFGDAGFPPDSVPYDAGLTIMPTGPGALADFAGELSTGSWTLSVTDNIPATQGVLNSWCLAFETTCPAPTFLDADSDCATGEVTLTWVNEAAYFAIVIFRDGVAIATLPGSAESFVDFPPAGDQFDYQVVFDCGGVQVPVSITVQNESYDGQEHVVFLGEVAGTVNDSAAALIPWLQTTGTVNVITDLNCLGAPSLAPNTVVWVLNGTFPNNYVLSSADGQVLADLVADGVSVYVEGASTFAFDPATPFDSYDGVDNSIRMPGVFGGAEDSLTSLNGSTASGLALSVFQGTTYTQENELGNELTDVLLPTGAVAALDTPAGQAGVVWSNDPDSPGETAYAVGVYYDTPNGFGDVMASTFELGGIDPAIVNDVIDAYRAALSAPDMMGSMFIRGDTNSDGTINIADGIYLLGILFPQIGTPPDTFACEDAADTNNDGTINIADVISLLSSLFGSPTFPLPPPNLSTGCGIDSGASLGCAANTPPC